MSLRKIVISVFAAGSLALCLPAKSMQRLSDQDLSSVYGGSKYWKFTFDRDSWNNAIYAFLTWGAIYAGGHAIQLIYDLPETWPGIGVSTACGSASQGLNQLWAVDSSHPDDVRRRVAALAAAYRAGSTIGAATVCSASVAAITKYAFPYYATTRRAREKAIKEALNYTGKIFDALKRVTNSSQTIPNLKIAAEDAYGEWEECLLNQGPPGNCTQLYNQQIAAKNAYQHELKIHERSEIEAFKDAKDLNDVLEKVNRGEL